MTSPPALQQTLFAAEHSGGSTEESRAFLQQRLKVMSLTCGALSLGFLVVSAVISLLLETSGERYTEQPAYVFHAAVTLLIAVSWLYTRRGQIPETRLTWIDTLGSIGSSVLLTLMGATMPKAEGAINALLAVCFVLIVRAIVVPSTGMKTFWVSSACTAAFIVTMTLVGNSDWARAHVDGGRISLRERVILSALWLTAATLISTFASRFIFGLQQEIRHARQIGQYVLKEKIGEGGMGVVYLATHAMLRRETAIKMLLPGRVSPTALARFEREVQQLARLNHPNTVAIYDYGRTPTGVFYYAMEFLEGLDLEQLVEATGPLPEGRVIHLLLQICASLAEAHEMGLIHRDIKPANIFICQQGGIPDSVKVLDFGLVKDMRGEGDVALTQTDRFLGTPLYSSPEAIRSPEEVTAASDIYSVATVGYFLLTGGHISKSTTLLEICADHLYAKPDRPSVRVGRPISDALEAAILRGLEKSPSDRHASARAFAAALRTCKDVTPWTDEDALGWWTTRGQELLAARKRSAATTVKP